MSRGGAIQDYYCCRITCQVLVFLVPRRPELRFVLQYSPLRVIHRTRAFDGPERAVGRVDVPPQVAFRRRKRSNRCETQGGR